MYHMYPICIMPGRVELQKKKKKNNNNNDYKIKQTTIPINIKRLKARAKKKRGQTKPTRRPPRD